MVTPVAEVDLKVGGRYRIHMQAPDGTVHKVTGTYQVVDPPQRLVYTWQWETAPEPSETLVTVEFHERGAGKTEVVLTHERFPNAEQRDRHQHGWTGCLEKFAALF
jgi:glutathione S-transferase